MSRGKLSLTLTVVYDGAHQKIVYHKPDEIMPMSEYIRDDRHKELLQKYFFAGMKWKEISRKKGDVLLAGPMDIPALLSSKVALAGGVEAFVKGTRLSEGYVQKVISGVQEPNEALLKLLGLTKVVQYMVEEDIYTDIKLDPFNYYPHSKGVA